jgi:hypothetical protein
MDWALPLEPGLSTHVTLCDHAGEHREWHGEGGDEAEALADLVEVMTEDAASPEAIDYALRAFDQRRGRAERETANSPGACNRCFYESPSSHRYPLTLRRRLLWAAERWEGRPLDHAHARSF